MAIDYEKEYDNRGRVKEHPEIFARNERDAAAYRAAARGAELGLKYGPSPRAIHRFSFQAKRTGRSRSSSRRLVCARAIIRLQQTRHWAGRTRRASRRRWPVTTFCPRCRLLHHRADARGTALYLWRKKHNASQCMGHSAGGHLAACMVATDWKTIAPDAPADLVPSGLFDLRRVRSRAADADLGQRRSQLDDKSARACSPLYWACRPGAHLTPCPVRSNRANSAPEPHRRRHLAQKRGAVQLRGDRRHQSFHRGRSAHRREQRDDQARGRLAKQTAAMKL